jgi:hypothetical protein
VRPVPRVTIDFGDGRKLERTVTGNSAHYVLDAKGRPLDVLPGLYGPQAFRAWLKRSQELASRATSAVDAEWTLAEYHAKRLQAIDIALRRDVESLAPQLLPAREQAVELVALTRSSAEPTAIQAMARAGAKTQAELPIVKAIAPSEEVMAAQSEEFWRQVAARHAGAAKLDEASVELVRRQNPEARRAGARATTKARVEDPILRLVRRFEEAMALDTVKNEYTLHRRVHAWFVTGEAPAEVDALNERVYAELFLTPSSDPWLGLAPANVYTALTEGGLTATP